jgi:hypothetical protein
MPIPPEMITEYGTKQPIILMDGCRTLDEAIRELQRHAFSDRDTFLVLSLQDNNYRVCKFLKLGTILKKMGPRCLDRPLAELPIPPASDVIAVDTPRPPGLIRETIRGQPEATVVIIDNNAFAGLMTNPLRGVADNLSLLELHGDLVKLREDLEARSDVPPPICPHCGHQGFHDYDLEQDEFSCIACGRVVN